MSALIVFPSGRWMRSNGHEITSRGEDVTDALPIEEGERSVAIISGAACIVRALDLPPLSDAQAHVAARMALAELGLASFGTTHVIAGAGDAEGRRTAVAASSTAIVERLVELAAQGIDPDTLLAAPLLLPAPEIGWIRGILREETVVRGSTTAFIDDAEVSPFLIGGDEVVELDRGTLEAAIIAAANHPEVDLRQGMFAKRRPWIVDFARLRRMAMLLLAIGVTVLTAQIVQIVRINNAASRLDADTQLRAAAILPPGTLVTDPALQAEARLAAVRGAGGGYIPLATTIAAAVSAIPNADVGTLTFDGDGGLRATIKGATAGDLDAVQARLVAAGLSVDAAPIVTTQGRPYRDMTVRQP